MTRSPTAAVFAAAGRLGVVYLVVLLQSALLQASLTDRGPFPVGIRDQRVLSQEGWIEGRLYYPALWDGVGAVADPSEGPYPLVALLHGYLLDPTDYDVLSAHLASWGFLVASTGTETGFIADTAQFASDTRELLYWVERSATNPFTAGWPANFWATSAHISRKELRIPVVLA